MFPTVMSFTGLDEGRGTSCNQERKEKSSRRTTATSKQNVLLHLHMSETPTVNQKCC